MADNKDKKVLNVPHLRFPEFSGEWEKCKVSDLLDLYSTNSLSWEQLVFCQIYHSRKSHVDKSIM